MERHNIYIMAVSLFATQMLFMGTLQASSENRPAIHIKHRIDNATVRNGLKNLWKLCVIEKEMLQKTKRSGHPAWPIMEKSLKEDRPDYDVDADLATNKPWEQYGIEFEDEYFYQDMYALYDENTKYEIAKDGRCSITSKLYKSAKLDNGEFIYRVDIDKGRAVKRRSPKADILENNKLIHSQAHEQAMVEIASKIGPINGALPQDAGSERIIGNHQCNYKSFGHGSMLCYWSEMSQYPSVVSRPIILKSKISVLNSMNIKQAIVFEVTKKLDRSIFEPKPEFKIVDRSRF